MEAPAPPHAKTDNIQPPPCTPSQVPALTQAGRPRRNYRVPKRPDDPHPEPAVPLPPPPPPTFPQMAPGSSALLRVILHVCNPLRTGYNCFGLLREYKHRPSYDPDSVVHKDSLATKPPQPPSINEATKPPPWPFRNMSIYLMMEWMITGSRHKSVGELDQRKRII